MIPNLTVGDLTIDCADAMRARGFYARLTGWEKTVAYGCPALKTGTGMTILFAEPDTAYIPPVWPEEEGREQKQAHLDFTADDLPSAVEQAVRLGALKAVAQYGEHCVTMFDTEGHPFCLCKRQEKSEFESYFKKKGYAVIPNPSVNIDCPDTKKLREFYAALTGWDTAFHPAALVTGDGMVVHFMQADFEYIPPVWPEEEGRQQKHMHFNFQVDDLTAAVEEAVRLGGSKAARQYGADHFVTMLDPDGHPFCLCKRAGI